jgi:hypothetical protein
VAIVISGSLGAGGGLEEIAVEINGESVVSEDRERTDAVAGTGEDGGVDIGSVGSGDSTTRASAGVVGDPTGIAECCVPNVSG